MDTQQIYTKIVNLFFTLTCYIGTLMPYQMLQPKPINDTRINDCLLLTTDHRFDGISIYKFTFPLTNNLTLTKFYHNLATRRDTLYLAVDYMNALQHENYTYCKLLMLLSKHGNPLRNILTETHGKILQASNVVS